jgi:hypothetical protein
MKKDYAVVSSVHVTTDAEGHQIVRCHVDHYGHALPAIIVSDIKNRTPVKVVIDHTKVEEGRDDTGV